MDNEDDTILAPSDFKLPLSASEFDADPGTLFPSFKLREGTSQGEKASSHAWYIDGGGRGGEYA